MWWRVIRGGADGPAGDPSGGGMGSDAQDMHPSSAHLHDEQCVQTRERDCVHMKEIRGQKPAAWAVRKLRHSQRAARRCGGGPSPAPRSTRRTVAALTRCPLARRLGQPDRSA